MTSKELKYLRRSDLLEMLLTLKKENDSLREELQQARQELATRAIAIEQAGNLAEAALRLNGIFEAAQAACEQYTENIHLRCADMERQTQEKCATLLMQAEQKTEKYSWLSDLMELPPKEK